MDITIPRNVLLKPLQLVCSVADKRHTLPILSNVLLHFSASRLLLVGSDLEVELIGISTVENTLPEVKFTLPAKKFLDICRSLPESADIRFTIDEDKVTLRSGSNRFTLSSFPAQDFPDIEGKPGDAEFLIPQNKLKLLFEKTAFAMAQQDVRYYLNGILIKVQQDKVISVATDGHRLACGQADISLGGELDLQVIIPRKGVLELNKLLNDEDTPVTVVLDKQRLSVTGQDFIFTSKLIEGRFPDYERVFPKQRSHVITAEREKLKQAISMASILSNEKHRGVRLFFEPDLLKISANNPEQEEAEVELSIAYQGDSFEVGFNASYLLDVLNVIDSPDITITLADQRSSALLEGSEESYVARYIVMPLQI